MRLNLALCEGRHSIPQAKDGAIFKNEIVDPTNTKALEAEAFTSLCEKGNLEDLKVNLYVTGLTVALIAVLNVCREHGTEVTLWHYDRLSGDYYPQSAK